MVDFKNMIGRVIDTVEIDPDREVVTFHYIAGDSRSFAVEGDCCSHSWIEHLELPVYNPEDLAGAQITGVDDSGEVTSDHDEHDDGSDVISVYNTVFHTNKGDIVLEYRNASNGYYGGYLVDA